MEHVGEVCANLLAALQVASTIQDIGVYGTTNLAAAMTKVPQPNLTTQEAWQAGDDIGQPGQLDPAERAIVGQLRENGHIIREVENRNIEKTPDILVDGEPTELKTVDAGGGKIAIFNKLKKAELKGGQAPNVLIDARATTISVDEAREEMESYLSKSRGVLQRVTIWLANGQKVTWPDGYEGL
ncbi:hypothetical protein GTS_19170 [Gandjariella thermophila]|uniref:tRNA nuclease CdiA C-terminal domain-containing protein n=1 Tax=Gandjariella thermophila TaxID=1931992 RepID=A0A4D4J494_9PSEU|nr:hypothetical protein GTS_19170 [Gandjariella thermophila]